MFTRRSKGWASGFIFSSSISWRKCVCVCEICLIAITWTTIWESLSNCLTDSLSLSPRPLFSLRLFLPFFITMSLLSLHPLSLSLTCPVSSFPPTPPLPLSSAVSCGLWLCVKPPKSIGGVHNYAAEVCPDMQLQNLLIKKPWQADTAKIILCKKRMEVQASCPFLCNAHVHDFLLWNLANWHQSDQTDQYAPNRKEWFFHGYPLLVPNKNYSPYVHYDQLILQAFDIVGIPFSPPPPPPPSPRALVVYLMLPVEIIFYGLRRLRVYRVQIKSLLLLCRTFPNTFIYLFKA